MIWLKKLASILLIGLGIFLWFAPFPLELRGEGTKDVLTLAAFVLGAFLLLTTYRASVSRPGVPIASPLLVLFCDLILLVGGTFVLGLALDALCVGPLGQTSLPGLFLALPLLSLCRYCL